MFFLIRLVSNFRLNLRLSTEFLLWLIKVSPTNLVCVYIMKLLAAAISLSVISSQSFPVILTSVNFIIAEVNRLFRNGESRCWVHDLFC
jgi:hypothetical protein